MARCSGSFLSDASGVYLALISAVVALAGLEAGAQDRPSSDVFQKVSFKTPETCTVESSGEITALVKNGVELSVREDWDCDGVPDAYDNCVGMANPSQADADDNGIGDTCETATTISSGRAEDRKKSEARSRETRGRKPETNSRKKKPEDKKRISRKDAKTQRKRR